MSHQSSDHGRSTTSRRARGVRSGLSGAGRTAFLVTLAGLAVAGTASAQTFPPDAQWLPLQQTVGGVTSVMTDPLGDAQNSRDMVGDASNPAAYVASDATHMYFRLRVSETVLQSPTNFAPFGWGCLLDTNGDTTGYEFSVLVDGVSNPDEVKFWQNSSQQQPNNPSDSPETLLKSYVDPLTTGATGFGYARQAPATSTFGGNPDFFIDWAVEKSVLAAAGVTETTILRIACGTGSNGNVLSADFTGAATLSTLFSDPILCSGTGCSLSCAGQGTACSAGVGECASAGVIVCVNGQPSCNAVPKLPTTEVCDGKDNNCDGTNDDGNPGGGAPCSSGLPGVCDAGLTTCANGAIACVSNIAPGAQVESCNALDDDCDGTADEGFNVGSACTNGVGACESSGTIQCTAGAAVCNAVPGQPATEVCANNIDEDCDGTLNNGCGCLTDADCGTADDGSICDLAGTFQCIPGCRGNNSNNGCPSGQYCTSTDATAGQCVACLTDLNCGGTDSGKVCQASVCIDGCRGTGGNSCPTTLKCTSVDNTVGTCVECLADTDCGAANSGKICNAATNACIAGCRGTGGNGCETGMVCTSTDNTAGQCVGCVTDTDCGDNVSGKVCDAANSTCIDGCRGNNGNGCPATFMCTSSDDTIGKCVGCVLDTDCGDAASGRICDTATSLCIDGCRGTGGNGCAQPLNCTSTDATAGQCVGCVTDAHCGDIVSGKICDETSQQCILGCRGTGGNGCPVDTKCTSTDATVGKCVACFVDTDCGVADSGKVCAADGTCIDGCRGTEGNGCAANLKCTSTDNTIGKCQACLVDADCGATDSGKVCSTEGACIDGCRGTNGNGCASGSVCSSTDDTIGTCSLPEGGAGGAAGAGGSGTGGSAGKGGAAGAGGSAGKGGAAGAGGSAGKGGAVGDAGLGGSAGKGGASGKGGAAGDGGIEEPEAEPGSLEGGGCSCSTESASSQTPLGLLMLGIAAIASRRRRPRN